MLGPHHKRKACVHDVAQRSDLLSVIQVRGWGASHQAHSCTQFLDGHNLHESKLNFEPLCIVPAPTYSAVAFEPIRQFHS